MARSPLTKALPEAGVITAAGSAAITIRPTYLLVSEFHEGLTPFI